MIHRSALNRLIGGLFWMAGFIASLLPTLDGSGAQAEVFVRNRDYKLTRDASVEIADTPHVLVSGRISESDVDAFERAVSELRDTGIFLTPDGRRQPIVIFDSPGGDVRAAMAMGRIARRELAWTHVKEGFRCDSACVLIYVAGVRRSLAERARLGIHRPFFEDYEAFGQMSGNRAMNAYDQMSRALVEYIDEMRVTPRVGERILRVPSDHLEYIHFDEADRIGLLDNDPAFQEWSIASQKAQLGADAYRAFNAYLNCTSSCVTNDCRSACSERTNFNKYYDGKTKTWRK